MRRLAILLAALLMAGCGSSKTSTTSSTKTASPTGPPATSTTSTTPAQTTRTTNSSTTTTSTTTSATATTGTQTAAVNARVPATFTILASGALSPPVITVPAQFPIELTVISNGSQGRRILLKTPQPVSLSVAPHGQAAARLKAPPPGRYALDIDGAPKGALVIGGSPGP